MKTTAVKMKLAIVTVLVFLFLIMALSNGARAANIFLLPIPKAQFLDSSGNPLVGGKLYTCKTSTTCGPTTTSNLKTTYTDSTGSVPNANPVVLDSAGRASVWIDGKYKMSLYTSTGVLVWTVDNISPTVYLQYNSDVDTAGGLAAAITAAGTTPTTYTILTDQVITSNLTVPATVTLDIAQGGKVSPASGVTVTINGYVISPPRRWIYGSGTVTITTYPQEQAWYGNNERIDVYDLKVATLVGEIKAWAGASPPAGWLLCYGQAVSRSTYSALYNVVGDTYGTGDGSTTFNVPDLRGRTLIGIDTMGGSAASRIAAATTLGYSAGVETHLHTTGDFTLTSNEMPAHTHVGMVNTAGTGTITHWYMGSQDEGAWSNVMYPSSGSTGTGAAHNHGNTQTVSNLTPYTAVNYLIRY